MKLFFTILHLLTSLYCNSQYQSIITQDSTSWSLRHEIWDVPIGEKFVLGDTITLNNELYNKTYLENTLLGYFREDTTSGKAWYWGHSDSSEHLIMDLSLNIGDTFLVKMFSDTNVTVTAIDTINGRKTLTLDYHYGGGIISEDLKFIEGVGPNAALFYQLDDKNQWFGFGYYLWGYLVCKMNHNNTIVYAWDTINFDCSPFVGIEEKNQNSNISIYPNPTKSKINIVLKNNSLLNKTIIIYNTKGQKLIMKKLDKSEIQIDLEIYSNQTFLYSIIGSEYLQNGKIIKE